MLVPTSLLPLHHKTCQLHVTRQWYPVTWCCVLSAWCCTATLPRLKLVTATLDELSARSDDPDEEVGATHMVHPLDSNCLAALRLSSNSMWTLLDTKAINVGAMYMQDVCALDCTSSASPVAEGNGFQLCQTVCGKLVRRCPAWTGWAGSTSWMSCRQQHDTDTADFYDHTTTKQH